MKNTNCQTCLFASPNTDPNPCEHGIIDHIKDTKKLDIVDNYYVINDYQCKMGFSKSVAESNKELSKEIIKSEILKNSCIKYYLVINLTHSSEQDILHLGKKLNELKLPPKYISFLAISKNNKLIYDALNKTGITNIPWKAHGYVDEIDEMDAANMALDTNLRNNGSQVLLFYDAKKIDDLDNDINEINTIINIDQTPLHAMMKKEQKQDELSGLFISFSSYCFLKTQDHNILNALNNIPNTIILRYGQ